MKPNTSERIKHFLINNAAVLLLYLALLLPSLYLIYVYDKLQLHLVFNQLVGSVYVNGFFYYITYLGDGFMAILILLIISVMNLRKGLYTALSFLLASLFSQFLKRYVFEDIDRPWMIFQNKQELGLRLVEGVDNHIHNSFPSGHATQAFAIFICLAFTSRNKLLKLFFFFIASLTAFSRVYISQHWLNDIVAGSLIGMIFSTALYLWFYQHPALKSLNRPLFAKKQKNESAA
ncbi:MAG: phosphatase PAP2 family protein [Bacteroidia bacterium]|nr:phosphatase PAP2 family protein [Bacteroidia bacterium]